MRISLPNFVPRQYQMPYWREFELGRKLRSLLVWHRRSGKDEVTMHKTAVAAHQRIATYWHMLPEYAQARKAIWNAINPHTGKRRIDEAFPQPIRETTNDQEMFIRFKCGSTWQLVGSDNYDSLVGTPPVGLVLSEWALANPGAWAYLSPILMENNGWADFITTPRGNNHVKAMYDAVKNDPEWFVQTLTVGDTGFSLARVERARREYVALFGEDQANQLVQQEYWCSFNTAVLGSFWGKEMIEAEVQGRIVDDLVPIEGLPIHRAWDFGVGDATSIWFFQVLFDRILVLAYYEQNNMGVDHFVDKIKEYADLYDFRYDIINEKGEIQFKGVDYVPHDARQRSWTSTNKDGTARQRLEVMKSLKLNPQLVPDHSIEDGVNAARTTLARCRFNSIRCSIGIEALKSYQREWDDADRIFSKTAKRNWAIHGADAFRYLSMAWRGLRKEAPKEEPKFIVQAAPAQTKSIMTTGISFNQLRDRNAKLKKERDRLYGR